MNNLKSIINEIIIDFVNKTNNVELNETIDYVSGLIDQHSVIVSDNIEANMELMSLVANSQDPELDIKNIIRDTVAMTIENGEITAILITYQNASELLVLFPKNTKLQYIRSELKNLENQCNE